MRIIVRLSTGSISSRQVEGREDGCERTEDSADVYFQEEEEKAYQKLLSLCGNEKMFLIRVKASRYNVSAFRSNTDVLCNGLES